MGNFCEEQSFMKQPSQPMQNLEQILDVNDNNHFGYGIFGNEILNFMNEGLTDAEILDCNIENNLKNLSEDMRNFDSKLKSFDEHMISFNESMKSLGEELHDSIERIKVLEDNLKHITNLLNGNIDNSAVNETLDSSQIDDVYDNQEESYSNSDDLSYSTSNNESPDGFYFIY